MNKKLIIAVVSLLVLSGCTRPSAVLEKIENKVDNKKESVKQSIKDLLASGVSQKCDWKTDDAGNVSEGQMWISGKKFKQEIKTTTAEDKKETSVSVISDGKYTYMWNSDMGKKGIKMELKEDQSQDYSTENGKVDINQQYQFECKPATVTEKDFLPPTDIDFQDLGIQLQELQKLQDKYGKQPAVGEEE